MTQLRGAAHHRSALVKAEALRLLSRRFTILALLTVVGFLGLFQVVVALETSPPSTEEVAAVRSEYEREVQVWETNHEQDVQECVAEGETPKDCASYFPRPQESDYGLAPVPFADIGSAAVQLSVYLSALALFLIAASFIGAEFATGSLANWLTFVPRRGAVYASKLVVMALVAVVVTGIAVSLSLGVTALLTTIFGGDLKGLGTLAAQGGRGLLVGLILAVVGFTVGLVTRHTAAAIGVLLGYLFLWFVREIIAGFLSWPSRLAPWTPESNLAAILNKGTTYEVITGSIMSEEGPDFVQRTISLTHGLVYWAVLLAVLVVGSLLIFRRRDVT